MRVYAQANNSIVCSLVTIAQMLRMFLKIPAGWSARNRPASPHDLPCHPLRDRTYVRLTHWCVDMPFIQDHMYLHGPVGYPSHSPCKLKHVGLFRFWGLDHDVSLVIAFWLCLHPLDPIVGRRMHGEEPSGPRPFGLHQPRQRGRHDPCAIAPDDLGSACGLCFGRPASTRARQSAGATGCHEMEG